MVIYTEKDVVFLIEGTSNLGLHYSKFKPYLEKLIEYFNEGAVPNDELIASNFENINYYLVTYGTKDDYPHPPVNVLLDTTNSRLFLDKIQNFKCEGGGGEYYALLADGLSIALEILDTSGHREFHRDCNVQRYCIIVAMAPPYPDATSLEGNSFCDLTIDELAMKMGQLGVHLSLIAPHKMATFQNIFDKANYDNKKSILPKDFVVDKNHLVCLKGIDFHVTDVPNVEIPAPSHKPEYSELAEASVPVSLPEGPGNTNTSGGTTQVMAWSGCLHWQEMIRSETGSNSVKRTLKCHVCTSPSDNLQTDKWPQELLMQLIPQSLLTTLGTLLHNSKTVSFHFSANDPESLKALYRVMATTKVRFAGCVHFRNAPNLQQCDVKILLLIFSPRKRAFVGLIPVDQDKFVAAMRRLVENHRKQQMLNAAAYRMQMQRQQAQQQQTPQQQMQPQQMQPQQMQPQQMQPQQMPQLQGQGQKLQQQPMQQPMQPTPGQALQQQSAQQIQQPLQPRLIRLPVNPSPKKSIADINTSMQLSNSTLSVAGTPQQSTSSNMLNQQINNKFQGQDLIQLFKQRKQLMHQQQASNSGTTGNNTAGINRINANRARLLLQQVNSQVPQPMQPVKHLQQLQQLQQLHHQLQLQQKQEQQQQTSTQLTMQQFPQQFPQQNQQHKIQVAKNNMQLQFQQMQKSKQQLQQQMQQQQFQQPLQQQQQQQQQQQPLQQQLQFSQQQLQQTSQQQKQFHMQQRHKKLQQHKMLSQQQQMTQTQTSQQQQLHALQHQTQQIQLRQHDLQEQKPHQHLQEEADKLTAHMQIDNNPQQHIQLQPTQQLQLQQQQTQQQSLVKQALSNSNILVQLAQRPQSQIKTQPLTTVPRPQQLSQATLTQEAMRQNQVNSNNVNQDDSNLYDLLN